MNANGFCHIGLGVAMNEKTWKLLSQGQVNCTEYCCYRGFVDIDVGDRNLKNVTSIKSSVSFTSRYNCRPNDLINHRRALVIKELINAIQQGQQGSIFKI